MTLSHLLYHLRHTQLEKLHDFLSLGKCASTLQRQLLESLASGLLFLLYD